MKLDLPTSLPRKKKKKKKKERWKISCFVFLLPEITIKKIEIFNFKSSIWRGNDEAL